MTFTEDFRTGIVRVGAGKKQVPRLAVAFAPAALGMTERFEFCSGAALGMTIRWG
jgi:hypothetical protein